MSLQATYLVNGAWTTRRIDIGEILARNREAPTAPVNSTRYRPPITGLLSRTVIQSPVIQWVLPARIRHPDKNDVIFVGDDYIQLKELVESGHLEDVVTKSDFDAKILGAKVISIRHDIALETHIKHGPTDEGIISSTPPLDQSLPPQLLVMVLASTELLFLYATNSPPGRLDFIHTRRPLPADVSSLEEYGRHLAIDPRSRAMAVSAASNFFGIFALKSPWVMQSEMGKGALNPIQEERFFRTEGDILAMDFLYPTVGAEERMILLLLVSKNRETHIVCYDWDGAENLRLISPKVIGRRLPQESRLPSVLIPLTKTTSFLLVTPSLMMVYKNILDANTARLPMRYPVPALEARASHNPPLWTQWARPKRNWSRNQNFDDVYLCREDGKILYLEIGKEGEIHRQSQLGQLGCNVDTGFAIIDGGFEAGDLLVAAGSMSDGGLFIEDARKPPRCIQKIPNWAPILDSVIVKAEGPQVDRGGADGGQTTGFSCDRIFACSGSDIGPGSITELRHGLEARIGLMIEQEGLSSVMDLWAMPHLPTGRTLFVFSNPLSTSVISMPTDAGEEIFAMDEETIGLDLDAQTLAAGITLAGVIVQVTGSSVRLSVLGERSCRFTARCQDSTENIIAAAVNGSFSLFAAAIRTGGDIHVHLRKVEIHANSLRCDILGLPLALTCEPISLAIEKLNSVLFLFIGTSDGKLLVAQIHPERGLVLLLEHHINLTPGNDESRACECLTIVTRPQHGGEQSTLFCGLRSGNLVPFHICFDEMLSMNSISVNQAKPYKLGDTSVRVRKYASDRRFAIVTCGPGLWRVSHVEDEGSLQYVLKKIWITDQNNPARIQPSVGVFACIEAHPCTTPGGLSGSLVCITENQLLACTLDKIPKSVPRHIHLPGSPKRLIYSEYLKRLVVGYNTVDTEVNSESTKRWIRPRIDFVDPNSQSPISSVGIGGEYEDITQVHEAWRPTGASGEKITALLDWHFTAGEHEYHMIVVGTAQPRVTNDGRLIYITARPNPQTSGHIDCTIKYVHTYGHAVRCIAPYGSCSLVISVGDEAILQTLDPASKRWRRMPGCKLESPPVSLSVREPYIYVLTSRHSLCILKVDNDVLNLYGQDGSDREGLDHLALQGGSQVTMTSNRGGAIVGLTEMGIIPEEKLIRPVFAAHVPLSIIRLNRSSRPTRFGAPEIIYGTTIGGTIYRFMTLGEKEWRLLQFIQNVSTKDPVICPFGKRKRVAIGEWDPPISKPESMHINGDMLCRVTDRGVSYLKYMMRSDDTSESSTGQANSNDSRKNEGFIELATPVVGSVEDPFVAVTEWMRNLLQIAL